MKLKIIVGQQARSSFRRDMEDRDRASNVLREMLAAGFGSAAVRLHWNLDETEMASAIARWRGVPVQLYLVDGSPAQQERFLRRWMELGGGPVTVGEPK